MSQAGYGPEPRAAEFLVAENFFSEVHGQNLHSHGTDKIFLLGGKGGGGGKISKAYVGGQH